MSFKVAMVGLTHPHSLNYLETLDALDEVSHVPLVDVDRKALEETARTYKKADGLYTSVEEVARRADVTHALVSVPTQYSVETLLTLARAGKHIFTEKPAARSAAEFQPVVDEVTSRRLSFGISYMNRPSAAFSQMRELVRGGAIGRLTSVEMRMVTSQVRLRNPKLWLFKKEHSGGGILSWLGCHYIDMLRHVSGDEVDVVSAQIATTNEEIDVEDVAAVSFRMKGGAVGSLHAGFLLSLGTPGYQAAAYDTTFIVRGTHGAITHRAADAEAPLRLESIAPGWAATEGRTFSFTAAPGRGYGGAHGLEAFRRFLNAGPGEAHPAGIVDGLRVLELLDAMYESGRTGRQVKVRRRRVSTRK